MISRRTDTALFAVWAVRGRKDVEDGPGWLVGGVGFQISRAPPWSSSSRECSSVISQIM